ncbi:MAG: hypothetical protein VB018_13160 [Lachnospiraceae bacterium]|nr:hypothetical protein [Lachnospiraceae bacterium]
MTKIDLNNLAGGATAEQINREITNVLSNIKDPNTDQQAKRKITITMTFTPDKGDSDVVAIHTICKPTLAPANGTSTRFLVGIDSDGKMKASEWGKNAMVGQIQVDDYVVDEDGEILEKSAKSGVIDFQAKANKEA